ncbi:MAG: beta-lactamase family protein, partial [Gemmatimonadales bacterium]|nr:beta-lactamase family protein [Gemmatimonadales bacterium]
MRILRRWLLVLLTLVTPLAAQQRAAPTPASVAARIDSLARQYQAEGRVAGLSVAVLYEGQTVIARGYGVANLETGEPVTDTTLFAVGSVTKQFATVAALLLVEAGKLSLD